MIDGNQAKRMKEWEKENTRFHEECLNREQLWTLTGSPRGDRKLALALQSSSTPPNGARALGIDVFSEATPQREISRITNGFIESFHNRLRDECLNREV